MTNADIPAKVIGLSVFFWKTAGTEFMRCGSFFASLKTKNHNHVILFHVWTGL